MILHLSGLIFRLYHSYPVGLAVHFFRFRLCGLNGIRQDFEEFVDFFFRIVNAEAYPDHAGRIDACAGFKADHGLVGISQQSPDVGIRAEGTPPGGNAADLGKLFCREAVHVEPESMGTAGRQGPQATKRFS